MKVDWQATANYSHYFALDGQWALIPMSKDGEISYILYGPFHYTEIRTKGGLYMALDMATALVENFYGEGLPA